jgi:hypothetical protein
MSNHINLISSDSKLFTRGFGDRTFKGCIGVCLSFTNPKLFEKKYIDFFSDFVLSNGFDDNRTIFKSYDLKQFFQNDNVGFFNTLQSFVSMLAENDVLINVVFSTFNTKLLPEVTKYGVGRYPSKKIQTLKFIDELAEYYPYIVVWKVSKTVYLKDIDVFLDSFTGEHTNAWGELCTHHRVNIIPKGDMCNPFISSADLVVRYIDEYIANNRLKLNEDDIISSLNCCGVENGHVFYVGQPDFDSIVPIFSRNINIGNYYMRPMVYILNEDDFKSKHVEQSPLWNKLLDFTYKNAAGIKFISYEEDYKFIRDGDYILYFGDKGESQAKTLEKLGYNILPLSSIDIINKNAKFNIG